MRSPVLPLLLGAALLGCSSRDEGAPPSVPAGGCESGPVTYYASSLAGHRTASGEPYDPQAMTAAHHRLPFGASVRVVWNHHEITVRINDRVPPGGPTLDLSRAAADELGMVPAGKVRAQICPL